MAPRNAYDAVGGTGFATHLAASLRGFARTRLVLVVLAYCGMLTVNILAGAGVVGDARTGEIADRYDGMLMPSSYAFWIWWLIYVLLALFVALFVRRSDDAKVAETAAPFVVVCSLNVAWLLLWQHDYFVASAIVLIANLCVSIAATISRLFSFSSDELREYDWQWIERVVFCVPMSVYMSWTTIAVAVQASSWIHKDAVDNETLWNIILLVICVCLVAAKIVIDDDGVPFFVLAWALIAIGMKMVNRGDGETPDSLFVTVWVFVPLSCVGAVGYMFRWRRVDVA